MSFIEFRLPFLSTCDMAHGVFRALVVDTGGADGGEEGSGAWGWWGWKVSW